MADHPPRIFLVGEPDALRAYLWSETSDGAIFAPTAEVTEYVKLDEISACRRALWELYCECKKLGMHDNTMSTETANVVAEVADLA